MQVKVPCGFCRTPAPLVVAWKLPHTKLAVRSNENVHDFVLCPECDRVKEAAKCGMPWGGPGVPAEPCSEGNYHACIYANMEQAHPDDHHRCACGAEMEIHTRTPEIPD